MHTRRFRGVALAALLAFPAFASALKYQPKGRPVEYKGHFSTFPSGMRLVVYEMPHVDRFILTVSHRAGSVDDPAGQEGLAHLVEHLAFRAAPGGAPALWAQLVSSGMRFNAFTAMDHTDYWTSGKPDELGQALRIEAARLKDPLASVTEDDFSIERDVVVAEWRERYETALDEAKWQWLHELAFPKHPYARPIGGTPESLRKISLADVQAWTKLHYRPAGVVVVVVAPYAAEHTARRVMEAFEPFVGDPMAAVQPIAYTPPPMPGLPAPTEGIPVRMAPVSQPELWVAWPVPGTYAGLGPQLLAVTQLLEMQITSRIATLALRGEVVDGFEVQLEPMDGASLIAVRILLHDATKAQKALDMVRFAAKDLEKGTSTPRLEGIRDWLLVRSYLQLESLSTPEIAQYLRATGKPDLLGDWPKRVAVQLKSNADRFAEAWLGAGRSSAVLVLPDRNIRARDLAGGGAALPAYAAPLEEETAVIPPPPPERVTAMLRAPGLAKAERKTLENGLEVAFLQKGTLPVADVRVALRTPAEGSAAAPLGAPLLALVSSEVSFVGEKLRGFGLTATEDRRADTLVLGARGSSGNLVDIVETEARWAKRLSFSGPNFDVAKKFARRIYEVADRHPLERTRRALVRGLFPDHPYGTFVTTKAVDDLGSRQASAWLDGNLRPDRASVLVVSDVAPSPEGWRWIEEEFGGWKRGGAGPVPPAPIAPLPAARTAVVVERKGATQALVAVGFRVPPLAERDAPAIEAVRWLLDSRLTQRIRVEEGVSYGVSVEILDHRHAAALVIAAAVEPEAAGRTVATILQAAQDLAGAPLAPASAARARWMVARQFAGRFERVADVAEGLERIALHGLPADYYDRMPERIASLDAARIQAAASTLSLGREAIVVSADRSIVPVLAPARLAPEVWPEP